MVSRKSRLSQLTSETPASDRLDNNKANREDIRKPNRPINKTHPSDQLANKADNLKPSHPTSKAVSTP